MHPVDCPAWEYRDHPRSSEIIQRQLEAVLVQLRMQETDTLRFVVDTRSVHGHVFCDLTPPDYDYYAGNYRGSEFRCLKHCAIGVEDDPEVGYPAQRVTLATKSLAEQLRLGIAGLDELFALPDAKLSAQTKLQHLVELASWVFVHFLTIHPYVNGNGHLARLIVWAMLGRYGYWPARWPIEPRTRDPEYMRGICDYRSGQPRTLEHYILRCLEPGE